MKVAAIVVTYNDEYKISEWFAHHQIYKDELYKHIIVDNGSNPKYIELLRTLFPESDIILRKTNGGSTAAYNDGIRRALEDTNVDLIMLIANDVKLEKDGVTKLSEELLRTKSGMISPILLDKDSMIVSDYGCKISKNLYMIPLDEGKEFCEYGIKGSVKSEAVTGGINLSSRLFYEKVGLQDEKLFMYSDEVDMGIRAFRLGFDIYCSNKILSWHQHINPPKSILARQPFSAYLIGRNKVYIARKHFGFVKVIRVFSYQIWKSTIGFIKSVLLLNKEASVYYYWMNIGAWFGFFGNMKQNRFSYPREKKHD
jgi:GT2 family glycosyltransferase